MLSKGLYIIIDNLEHVFDTPAFFNNVVKTSLLVLEGNSFESLVNIIKLTLAFRTNSEF